MNRKIYLVALSGPLTLCIMFFVAIIYVVYTRAGIEGKATETIVTVVISSPLPILIFYFVLKRFIDVLNGKINIATKDSISSKLFFNISIFLMLGGALGVFFVYGLLIYVFNGITFSDLRSSFRVFFTIFCNWIYL